MFWKGPDSQRLWVKSSYLTFKVKLNHRVFQKVLCQLGIVFGFEQKDPQRVVRTK